MLLVFIINPRAGNGRSNMLIERLCSKGEVNGLVRVSPTQTRRSKGCILQLKKPHATAHMNEIRVYRNSKLGNSLALCRELSAKYGKELVVVACGGDGTVNEVTQGLYGTEAGMLVIPFGSGNDFSKSIYSADFHNSTRLLEALGLDDKGCLQPEPGNWPDLSSYYVDVIEFKDDKEYTHCSVNVISIGFDSSVAITAAKWMRYFPQLGKMAYMLSIPPALFKKKRFRLQYKLWGRQWRHAQQSESAALAQSSQVQFLSAQQDYSLAALANAHYYGGGFQPNPFMNLQDGVIELVISKPLSLGKIAHLVGAYRKGTAQASGVLTMFSAKAGQLKSAVSGEPMMVTYDGEVLYSDSLDFEVKAQALRLCLPRACVHEQLQVADREV